MGVGVLISGGRFDTVDDNDIHDNGAWGVLLVPEVDTETWIPIAHCHGGIGLKALSFCYYDDWGSEVENNTLSHNGFFGNPSNGDLAEISNLAYPGNCWHGNVDTSGTVIGPKHFQLGRPGVMSAPPLTPSTSPTTSAESRTRAQGSRASSVWRSPATRSSSAPARAPKSRTTRARRRSR